MEHELKVHPEHFENVRLGMKPFELRKNDRDFKMGDTLWLREYEPGGRYKDGNPESGGASIKGYTGRELKDILITLVLDNPQFLQPGFVALGLSNLPGCNYLGNFIQTEEKA